MSSHLSGVTNLDSRLSVPETFKLKNKIHMPHFKISSCAVLETGLKPVLFSCIAIIIIILFNYNYAGAVGF